MAFDKIPFTDLVKHSLLDDFEFSAHSFSSFKGPYFWNGVGIDFESPFPEADVIKDAKNHNAKIIYAAHTHPLSNDDSLDFMSADIDPREEIAYGHRVMPVGNPPSMGDVKFLKHIKNLFAKDGIDIVGLVFSAGGIWKFNIKQHFKLSDFNALHAKTFPLKVGPNWVEHSQAKAKFPNYFMELQKPKLRSAEGYDTSYKPQLTEVQNAPDFQAVNKKQITKILNFYNKNNVNLTFHPYAEFNVDPLALMRQTLLSWNDAYGGANLKSN